jgi:hypothetical protein
MLGHVAYDGGDYAKAEAMFQRALTITEKALGPDNLKVAGKLDSLAMLGFAAKVIFHVREAD